MYRTRDVTGAIAGILGGGGTRVKKMKMGAKNMVIIHDNCITYVILQR